MVHAKKDAAFLPGSCLIPADLTTFEILATLV